jgi:hypothetical protein
LIEPSWPPPGQRDGADHDAAVVMFSAYHVLITANWRIGHLLVADLLPSDHRHAFAADVR